MGEYTPTTEQIKDLCLLGAIDAADGEDNLDLPEMTAMVDRWLTAHDAAARTAALEEAGRDLLRGIGIQSTNGIGWMPADSLHGAGRYLLHISHAAKVAKS